MHYATKDLILNIQHVYLIGPQRSGWKLIKPDGDVIILFGFGICCFWDKRFGLTALQFCLAPKAKAVLKKVND